MNFLLDVLSLIIFVGATIVIYFIEDYAAAAYLMGVAIFLQIVSWRGEE